MKIISIGRNIKHSPKKMITLAKFINNKNACEALDYLSFIYKKSSIILRKILNSAISNAEHNYNLDIDDLKISEIYINKGLCFKRVSYRAKGRMDKIIKRTSNITIILSINRCKKYGTKSQS